MTTQAEIEAGARALAKSFLYEFDELPEPAKRSLRMDAEVVLSAALAARVPLTENEIADVLDSEGAPALPDEYHSTEIEIVRAIERAHGIRSAP